jgi:hypothetical protein
MYLWTRAVTHHYKRIALDLECLTQKHPRLKTLQSISKLSKFARATTVMPCQDYARPVHASHGSITLEPKFKHFQAVIHSFR